VKQRAAGKSAGKSPGKWNAAVILIPLSNRFSSATERAEIRSQFLLDTSLSSSVISNNSTRHSVTSRIDCNPRAFCYLIFSTRHLNATLEKRTNVEKFNTRVRFFAASASFPEKEIARGFTVRKNSHERTGSRWHRRTARTYECHPASRRKS
jgi:hypothetical protein